MTPVRASDSEREQFRSLLIRHFEEGRITEEELGLRLEGVDRAQSLEELYGLVSDLPHLSPYDVARRRRGATRGGPLVWLARRVLRRR